MTEILKEELWPEEKVLWSGKADEFVTLDSTNKAAYIRRAITILGIVIGLCLVYIVYVTSKGIELKLGLVAIAIAFAVLGSVNFYSDAKKLRRAFYAVTNKRIISIIDVPKSVEYARINAAQLKTDEDGHVSLLCGKKVIQSKSHKWRMFALLDPYIEPETGICERFALYAVSDAENLKKILSDLLPV